MIDPLVLKAFNRKLVEKTARVEKIAVGLGTLGLLGLGGAGALGLTAAGGMAGNIARDMNYGRAERLEEKARRMKAISQAKMMPQYNPNLGGGGV